MNVAKKKSVSSRRAVSLAKGLVLQEIFQNQDFTIQ
jgi:hypothetical protein